MLGVRNCTRSELPEGDLMTSFFYCVWCVRHGELEQGLCCVCVCVCVCPAARAGYR